MPNKTMAIIKIQTMEEAGSLRKREAVVQTIQLILLQCLSLAKSNLPHLLLLHNLQPATY
jgi:hypothetical protein